MLRYYNRLRSKPTDRPRPANNAARATSQEEEEDERIEGVDVQNDSYQALLDNHNLEQVMYGLVVRQVHEINGQIRHRFAYFPSYVDFRNYLMDLPPVKRTFNEVIFGEQRQKLRFDLDIKDRPDAHLEVRDNVIAAMIAAFYEVYAIQLKLEEILICTAHGTDIDRPKNSYHLIIPKYAVSSHREARHFYEKVKARVREEYHTYLDGQIYSSTACLRTYESTKIHQSRFKIVVKGAWIHLGQFVTFKPLEDDPTHVQWFEYSLVTVTSQCTMLPDKVPNVPRVNNGAVPQNVSDDTFAAAVNKFGGIYSPVNSPRYCSDNTTLLSLNRNHPAYCAYCKREHTSNGGHLLYVHDTGAILFRCYADSTRKHHMIIAGTRKGSSSSKPITLEEYLRLPSIGVTVGLYPPDKVEYISTDASQVAAYDFGTKNTLCVKANCGIGKTQTLIQYITGLPKETNILVVSFRRTLVNKQEEDFEGLEFVNYQVVEEHKITVRRLIVQIDSLHRARNAYDVIILDESEYSMDHYARFVHRKEEVYEALIQHLRRARQVICLDALMSDLTIEFMVSVGRTIRYLHYTHQVYTESTLKIIDNKAKHTVLIDELLTANKKIFIPTNSKRYAESLAMGIHQKFPHLRVGLYIGLKYDNESRSYSELMAEWEHDDVAICSPTIVAGLSFIKEHFDVTAGYFTSTSAGPELALQQLFRVRPLRDKTIYVCVDQYRTATREIMSIEDIRHLTVTNWDYSRENINIVGIDGKIFTVMVNKLKVDYTSDSLKRDDPYFLLFTRYVHRLNRAQNSYLNTLCGSLREHGFQYGGYYQCGDQVAVKEARRLIREISKEVDAVNDADIINAPTVTHDGYNNLLLQKEKTKEEYFACAKYRFKLHYRIGDESLTPEFVRLYHPFRPKFFNIARSLALLYVTPDQRASTIANILDKMTQRVERNPKAKHKTIRILSELQPKFLKVHQYEHCINFLVLLGFKAPLDESKIEINKGRLFDYFMANKDFFNSLYGTRSIAESPDKAFAYANSRLSDMFGIKIKVISKYSTFYSIVSDVPLELIHKWNTVILMPRDVVMVDPHPTIDPILIRLSEQNDELSLEEHMYHIDTSADVMEDEDTT